MRTERLALLGFAAGVLLGLATSCCPADCRAPRMPDGTWTGTLSTEDESVSVELVFGPDGEQVTVLLRADALELDFVGEGLPDSCLD